MYCILKFFLPLAIYKDRSFFYLLNLVKSHMEYNKKATLTTLNTANKTTTCHLVWIYRIKHVLENKTTLDKGYS